MNKIFKVVWSKTKECYVVVSEVAKNNGGKKKVLASVLAGLAMVGAGAQVQAYSDYGGHDNPSVETLALGPNTWANQEAAVAVGIRNNANGQPAGKHSVAIGSFSNANGEISVAMGGVTNASGKMSVAVGYQASATDEAAVALGNMVSADKNSTGVGPGATASGTYAFAGGYQSETTGISGVAIGDNAKAKAARAMAIGGHAEATAEQAIAIGSDTGAGNKTTASKKNAIAVGHGATASGLDTAAIGTSATASGQSSVALGNGTQSTNLNTTAIGSNVQSTKTGSIGIGGNVESIGDYSVAIGSASAGKTVKAVDYATAVGGLSNAAERAAALGAGADAAQARSVAIGYKATASTADGVAIGSTSVASTAAGVQGFNPADSRTNKYGGLTSAAQTSTLAAVSIGNGSAQTRQITGLAAGKEDTDAVNVAQLRSVNLKYAADTGNSDFLLTDGTLTVKGDNDLISTSVVATGADKGAVQITAKVGGTITHTDGKAVKPTTNGIATTDNVVDAINDSYWKATAGGNTDGTPTVGNVKPGTQVTYSAGDNLKVKQTIAANGDQEYKYSLNPVLTGITSIANTTTGPKMTFGGNSINITGGSLDMGTNKITNLAPGTADNDAVNVKQLKDTELHITPGTYTPDASKKVKLTYTNGNNTVVTGKEAIIDLSGLATGGTASTEKVQKAADVANDTNIAEVNPKTGDTFGGAGATYEVSVSRNAVKDAAREAVTVNNGGTTTGSTYTADTNNPISVTATPDNTNHNTTYAVTFDGNKAAKQIPLTYKATNGTTTTADQTVKLDKGLNFTGGNYTTASVGADGKVTFDVTLGTTPTVTDGKPGVPGQAGAAGKDGIATVKTVVDTINNSGWKANAKANGGKLDGNSTATVVKPGDQVNFAAGKNLTVKQDLTGEHTYTYSLNKDLKDLTSVEIGGSTIKTDGDHITITSPDTTTGAAPGTTVTNKVANLGDEKHIKPDTYAVANDGSVTLKYVDGNGKDLTETTKITGIAKKAKVINGKNTTVEEGTDTSDNSVTYKVNVKGDLADISSITNGTGSGKISFEGDQGVKVGGDHPISFDGKGGYVTGLQNKDWDITNPTVVSGRAATEDQLKKVSDGFNNTVKLTGNSGATGTQKLNQNGGLSFGVVGADNGKYITTTASGSNVVADLSTDAKAKLNSKVVVAGSGAATVATPTVTTNPDGSTVTTYTVHVDPATATAASTESVVKKAVTGDTNIADVSVADGKATGDVGAKYEVSVSRNAVKDAAREAVTVNNGGTTTGGTYTADTNNPISVTATPDNTNHNTTYAVTFDGNKAAKQIPLTYKANGNGAKTVTLEKGLDFTNGTNTTAEIDNDGVVKYNLNKDVDLSNTGSLKVGGTTVNNGGITIKVPTTPGTTTTDVKLTNTGLDNGGNKIVNVAEGKADTDAVNVKQLKDAKTKLVAGENTTVEGDGTTATPYKVNVKGDLANISSITNGAGSGKISFGNDQVVTVNGDHPISLNGKTGDITGLTNTTIPTGAGSDFATKGRAATEEQLKIVNDKFNNKINLGADGNTETNKLALDNASGIKFNIKGDGSGTSGANQYISTTANGSDIKVDLTADAKAKLNKTYDVTSTDNSVTVSSTTTNGVTTFDLKVDPAAGTTSTWDIKSSADTANGGATATGHETNAKTIANAKTVEMIAGKNLTVKQTSDTNGAKVEFALSDKITVGKDGTNGVDGKIGVNGKDGASVVIDGKDGSIGLTGPQGATGAPGASATLKVKDGVPGVDGAPGTNLTRIVYTDKNNVEHEVATHDDGMKFAGDDGQANQATNANVIKKHLNNVVDIIGGATKADLTTNNIGVNNDGNGKLLVQLSKNLNGINTVKNGNTTITLNDAPGGATNTPAVTISGGNLSVDGNKVTNVDDGTNDSDAVNLKQLKAAKTEVKAGENVTVKHTTDGTDNHNIYTVSAVTPAVYTTADGTKVYKIVDPTTGAVTWNTSPEGNGTNVNAGDVITSFETPANGTTKGSTTGGTMIVNNVGSAINGKTGATYLDKLDAAAGDNNTKNAAVNVTDLKNTKDGLIDKGLKFDANVGGVKTNKLGSTVKVQGAGTSADADYSGANIKTFISQTGDDTTIDVKLDKNLKGINKISNGGSSITLNDTPSATVPAVTITGGNLSMGDGTTNNKIVNLAPGTADTDAVNVKQLKDTELHITPGTYTPDTNKKVTLTYTNGNGTVVSGKEAVIDLSGLSTGGATASTWNVKSSANTTDGGAVGATHDATAQNIANGKTVEFQSGKNLVVNQTNDTTNGNATVEFSLSDNITVGKDGVNGKEGSVGAKGTDGSAVVMNGKDGSIGLNGTNGANGISIKGKDGANGVGIDGKDGVTRIVYTEKVPDPANPGTTKEVTHEVATMDDGLKFTGNNTGTVNKHKLGSLVKVQGEGVSSTDEAAFVSASGNIAVTAENNDTLTIRLNKNLKGLNSIQLGGNTIQSNGDNITFTTNGGTTKTVATTDQLWTIQANGTDVPAKSGKVNLVAGDHITITPDAANGKMTISATGFGSMDGFNVKTSAESATVGTHAGDTTENIKNGKTVDMQAGKNLIVTQTNDGNGNTTVNYALNKDVDLGTNGSLKAGDTTVNKDGVTIANGPSITKTGVDAGDKKITNVADGAVNATSKDAVNGSQLKKYTDAAKTTVEAGDNNVKVDTDTTAADGHTNYKVSLKPVVTIGDTHKVKIDGQTGDITGLTNVDLTDPTFATKGRAATEEQLNKVLTEAKKKAVEKVQAGTAAAGDTNIATVAPKAGDTFGAAGATYEVSVSKNAVKDAAKEAVKVTSASPAITVTADTSVAHETTYKVGFDGNQAATQIPLTYKQNGGNTRTVKLSDGLNFIDGTNTKARTAADGKVTFDVMGDLTGITSISNAAGGPKMTFGGNSINVTGGNLDMGGKKITNIGKGTDPTDAARVGQLTKVTSNNHSVVVTKTTDADGAPVYDLAVTGTPGAPAADPRVDMLGEEIGRVGAQGAALSALKPIQYDPLEPTQIMAGYGNYRGNSAVALGVAHYKNESTLIHGGVSWAGGSSHMMANAGVTWKVGNRDSEAAVADRYRKGPISSAYAMQQEMAAMKAQNAGLKGEVSDLKAENEQMKAQIAAMMAKLGL